MEAATATKAVTFIAKCPNQILVMEQAYDLRDENGRKYGVKPNKQIEFENEVFVADESSAARIGVPLEDIIDHIRNHELFGVSIYEDSIPEALEPSVESQVKDIYAAASKNDPEAINAIIQGERDTHNRVAVLATARAALEQIAGETEQE